MKSYSKILVFVIAALIAACSGKEQFTSGRETESFTVDYNPEYLDVLWVVDDRSPLIYAKNNLLEQASLFFTRLDRTANNYRMAMITSDMAYAKGKIRPLSSPSILVKTKTEPNSEDEAKRIKERTSLFGSTMTQLFINLGTGASPMGFLAAQTSLQQYFIPRKNVPLVLVFISDSDDKSTLPSGTTDSVEYYKSIFIGLKDGNSNLVRSYSINYETMTATDTTATKRCATETNADIDKSDFQDNYFKLAKAMGGSTANLCGSFSSVIDLSGLRLKALPNSFQLSKKAQPGTFIVDIKRGDENFDLKWTFDEAANKIVFETTPPEGTTINVTYKTF